MLGGGVFAQASAVFRTYHFDGSLGFTVPTWEGYPSVNMGSRSPVKPWLLGYGIPFDTEPTNDLNGDGVSLLMAYALDLDPTSNPARKLPKPILEGETLQLSFYAKTDGITYVPETSTNLSDWTSADVNLSALDATGRRTASVPVTEKSRFLRPRVQHE